MAEQIYVGTEKGLFRLAREGDAWALQASGLGDQEIEAVASHPDGRHAIAGTHGAGLFSTANAGESWEHIADWQGSPYIRSVSYHPHDPQIVRVGTEPARVWCSRDGGATWAEESGFTALPRLRGVVSALLAAGRGSTEDNHAGRRRCSSLGRHRGGRSG